MHRNLSILFARRYFRSRGSLSVINVISRVSTIAVAIPVAAMVILLSVFNGFAGLVEGMYNDFDADLLVKPVAGKVFIISDLEQVKSVDGVETASFILEESVLIEYRGAQQLATIRGVDSTYSSVVPIEELVVVGKYELRFGQLEQAVVGRGIAYSLGINTAFYNALTIYAPRRGEFSSLLPIANYNVEKCFPTGIFMLDEQTDSKYVITTLEFAQNLLDYHNSASAVMLKVSDADLKKVQKDVQTAVGTSFEVLDRQQQNPSMFRIIRLEKWAIFFITLLVLIIASCSVVGTLVMLILDKRHDIATLRTIGGTTHFIRRVFVAEGMLISGIGVVGGILLGAAFCFIQQQWGIIKIGAESFIVDAYPVVMKWSDILIVLCASVGVNYAIARLTVRSMVKKTKINS